MNQMILLLFLFLLLLIAAGSLCYYIFSLVMIDAKSRGIKNPKFWSLIAAGGQHGEGLILYLFTRRKSTSTMNTAETAQFLKIKRKLYYLLAVIFVIFMLFVIVIFRYN